MVNDNYSIHWVEKSWEDNFEYYDDWLNYMHTLNPSAKMYNYVGCHQILALNELTEKYCEGTLPSGWYYVQEFDGPDMYIQPAFYRTDDQEVDEENPFLGFFDGVDWRGVAQILAKVPTWEEAQELEKIKKIHNDKKMCLTSGPS